MPAADPAPPAARAGRRWPRRIVIAGVLLAALVLWLWNGPGAAAAAELRPFEIERRADGSWPEIPADEPPFTVSLSIGSSSSRTVEHSSQGSNAEAGARFASRSFLVTTRGADALTEAVAQIVIAGLQANPHVRRLAYLPRGAETVGGIAPDVVVEIDDAKLEQDTFAGNGDVRASILATACDQLTKPRVYRGGGPHSPRRVAFHVVIDVETTVDQGGIITPNALLAATATRLAGGVMTGLKRNLASLREDHGDYPPLPEPFYPVFRAVDAAALPLDGIDRLERLASWRGVFLHNETWWRGVLTGPLPEARARLVEQFTAAGYEQDEAFDDKELLFQRGREKIRVSVDEPVKRIIANLVVPEDPERDTPVFVCYREHASDEAIERAIDSTLAEDVAPEVMTLFAPAWNESQRERGLARIEARGARRPEDMLLRARLRESYGELAGAREDAWRAVWLARTAFGAAIEERAVKAAKKLEVDVGTATATPERLAGAGFSRLPDDGAPIEQEVRGGHPLRCFLLDGDEVVLLAVGLERAGDGSWQGAFRRIESGLRSQTGAMSRGTTKQVTRAGTTIEVELLDAPDGGASRARIAIER